MRKLFILLLALIGVLGLSACKLATKEETPHTHTYSVSSVIVSPTCTAGGVVEMVCSCGDSYLEEVAPVEHTFVEQVVEPTCTEAGYTVCTCSCGYQCIKDEQPSLGHRYRYKIIAPTCTEQGYTRHTCARCKDVYFNNYVAALGHDYTDWQVSVSATCTASGVDVRVCSRDASHTEACVSDMMPHTPAEPLKENIVKMSSK